MAMKVLCVKLSSSGASYVTRYALVAIFFTLKILVAHSQPSVIDKASSETKRKKLLFADDFNTKLDKGLWIVEMEPIAQSTVMTENGKLSLNTGGGVTVWFNKILQGNIQVEYTRAVIVQGADNDRLSDLNQFWMASDPKRNILFTRRGKFEEYDSLLLYYVGVGGNSNSTTRFRKYNGSGERVLLHEYLNKPYLLEPNKVYHIKIIMKDNTTSFFVDDKVYFFYRDPESIKTGYFGFRSTSSHQVIDNFRVYELD